MKIEEYDGRIYLLFFFLVMGLYILMHKIPGYDKTHSFPDQEWKTGDPVY